MPYCFLTGYKFEERVRDYLRKENEIRISNELDTENWRQQRYNSMIGMEVGIRFEKKGCPEKKNAKQEIIMKVEEHFHNLAKREGFTVKRRRYIEKYEKSPVYPWFVPRIWLLPVLRGYQNMYRQEKLENPDASCNNSSEEFNKIDLANCSDEELRMHFIVQNGIESYEYFADRSRKLEQQSHNLHTDKGSEHSSRPQSPESVHNGDINSQHNKAEDEQRHYSHDSQISNIGGTSDNWHDSQFSTSQNVSNRNSLPTSIHRNSTRRCETPVESRVAHYQMAEPTTGQNNFISRPDSTESPTYDNDFDEKSDSSSCQIVDVPQSSINFISRLDSSDSPTYDSCSNQVVPTSSRHQVAGYASQAPRPQSEKRDDSEEIEFLFETMPKQRTVPEHKSFSSQRYQSEDRGNNRQFFGRSPERQHRQDNSSQRRHEHFSRRRYEHSSSSAHYGSSGSHHRSRSPRHSRHHRHDHNEGRRAHRDRSASPQERRYRQRERRPNKDRSYHTRRERDRY